MIYKCVVPTITMVFLWLKRGTFLMNRQSNLVMRDVSVSEKQNHCDLLKGSDRMQSWILK